MNQRTNKMTIEQINAQYGKIPPQCCDLEEAVLGALMLEAEAFENIDSILSEVSFYKETHQKIFRTIKSMHDRNKPIDLMMVTREIINLNLLDEIGGPMYITQLTSKVASAAHIAFHARIIQQKFVQRELIRIGTMIQTQAYDDTQDVDDLLAFAESSIENLSNGSGGADGCKSTEAVAEKTIEELKEDYEKAKEGKLIGIPTGFFELDKGTSGWRSPNFIILAARPSVGKTSLMLRFIVVAAKAGFWVNVYGYEMNSEDLYRIILSGESGVSRTKVRDAKFTELDWDEINRANQILRKLPILWYDKSDIKSGKIKSNTKKNIKSGKCDMVFADYLQLIPPEEESKIREQQISKISRTLKSVTLDCHVPLMALAQLNREVETRGAGAKPRKGDLRESGSLEQDTDIILFPFKDENDDLILSIAKHRRGKCYDIPIRANEDMTQFYDMNPQYEDYPDIQNVSSKMPVNSNFEYEDDKPF